MVWRIYSCLSVGAVVFGLGLCANAATIYNEAVDGDLSNSGLTPTVLNFAAGSNQVLGTTGRNSAGAVDRDYLTFSVPSGLWLTALTPLPGTQTAGPAGISFIGLEAGNQVTLATNAATATGLLGWTHYGPADIGFNILNYMAPPNNGSSGFTVPLGPGNYSVWIQELSTGTFNYGFDFTLNQVPEPGTWLSLISGLGLLGAALRSRLRQS